MNMIIGFNVRLLFVSLYPLYSLQTHSANTLEALIYSIIKRYRPIRLIVEEC